MAYRKPQTSLDVFTNPDQLNVIREIRERLDDLEAATATGTVNSGGKKAPLPPRPSLSVTSNTGTAPGHFFVQITNPEYSGTNQQNKAFTPIIHQLESSTDAGFSTGVTTWPPGVQTTYTITQFGSSKRYFRVRSSYDGKNFTQPIPVGPVQS